MATKKKVVKLDEPSARKVILEYMEKEYRPYGVTDLVLNLHNQISKVMLVKILEELVEQKFMIVKRYGKLSFYCFAERKLDADIEPVSLEMIKASHKEIEDIEQDLNAYRKDITQLESNLGDAELIQKVKDLECLLTENQASFIKKKEEFSGFDPVQNEKNMAQVEKREKVLMKKYKTLKKIHSEVINTLKESMPNVNTQLVSKDPKSYISN